MTLRKRILDLLISALIIFVSIIMILMPNEGVVLASAIFSFALMITGIRSLVYYFHMARYMVGGKIHLYIGIIILDLGLLVSSIILNNSEILIIFLQAFYGFSGVIDILRARESKKAGAPIWKLNMVNGIINITIMALAFIYGSFYQSTALLVYIFCIGLIYSAVMRIVTAFRKTAVVYIQ